MFSNLRLNLKNLKTPRGKRRNGKGYTFIEIAFALVIMGTVIFTVLTIFKMVSRSMWQVDEKSQLERALVFTMDQMVQEIRQARGVSVIGPVAPAAAFTWDQAYAAGVTVNALPMTTIHLDPAGTKSARFKMPNLNNPLDAAYDGTLIYFLRQRTIGTATVVQLYQRLRYYDNTYTQAFPAMGNTDQFRLGKPTSASILKEPTTGANTPTVGANTPTIGYFDSFGRMPGSYASSRLTYEDVSFFYDSINNIIAVGLTLSLKSQSLSWRTSVQRRTLSLTSSVAFRRTQ